MSLNLEKFEELPFAELVVEARTRKMSMYRLVVERVLQLGENRKITCEYRGRAQRIASNLKNWVGSEEKDKISVMSTGNIVYILVRGKSDD